MPKRSFQADDRIDEYLVDYAATNKAGCRACDRVIAKHSLKYGEKITTSKGREFTRWYHANCFVAEVLPEAVRSGLVSCREDILDAEKLSLADQEYVRRVIEEHQVEEEEEDESSLSE